MLDRTKANIKKKVVGGALIASAFVGGAAYENNLKTQNTNSYRYVPIIEAAPVQTRSTNVQTHYRRYARREERRSYDPAPVREAQPASRRNFTREEVQQRMAAMDQQRPTTMYTRRAETQNAVDPAPVRAQPIYRQVAQNRVYTAAPQPASSPSGVTAPSTQNVQPIYHAEQAQTQQKKPSAFKRFLRHEGEAALAAGIAEGVTPSYTYNSGYTYRNGCNSNGCSGSGSSSSSSGVTPFGGFINLFHAIRGH